jgi:uncharacterized protein YggE
MAAVGRLSAAHGDMAAPSTVTTAGHGVVSAVPDRATVTAGVHTVAETAAAALAQSSKLVDAVVAALRAAGGARIQTQQVSLYPQTTASGRIKGYAADDSVSASTSVSAAGPLIDAAVSAGANTVSGPTLEVSTRDALYRQALQKAVGDARAKAEALASAGGFALGPITAVSEGPAQVPVDAASPAGRCPAGGATSIEPGEQDVAADVTVTFGFR